MPQEGLAVLQPNPLLQHQGAVRLAPAGPVHGEAAGGGAEGVLEHADGAGAALEPGLRVQRRTARALGEVADRRRPAAGGDGGHRRRGHREEGAPPHPAGYSNRLLFGKPFGGALPAPARLPRQPCRSVSTRTRSPSRQESPSRRTKTLASASPVPSSR